MTTPADIIREVRDILHEPAADAAMWSDETLRRWINEATRDLARASRHVKHQSIIPLESNQNTYTLPANTIAVESVFWLDRDNLRSHELEPVHLEDMRSITPVSSRPSYFTVLGSQPNITMFIWPVPADTGDSLSIFTCITPDEIAVDGSDDATEIDFPHAWYDALADYVEYKALRRDRDQRWQEAFQIYQEKRDGLIVNPDYLSVSRGFVRDGRAGDLPTWLTDFDW